MKKEYLLSFLIIIIDQIIKLFISKMELFKSIVIIPNFFKITYVKNTGAAFSIFSNNTLMLIVISFLFLYLYYLFVLKNKNYTVPSILLIGGIIANLIDRVFRGYVIDYLDFNLFGYEFPIFNFADICIVIGSLILIIYILKDREEIK